MKPRRFSIAAPFVVAGLACGVLPARSAEPHWPQAVALATASPGGTYHAYGAGLARVLTRELGIAVSMRETAGPSENIRLIEAGEAHIGFVTTGAALEGWSKAARHVSQLYDRCLAPAGLKDAPSPSNS